MMTAFANALEDLHYSYQVYIRTHYPEDPALEDYCTMLGQCCEAAYLQLQGEPGVDSESDDAALEEALVDLANRFGEDALLDYLLRRLTLMTNTLKRVFEGVKARL